MMTGLPSLCSGLLVAAATLNPLEVVAFSTFSSGRSLATKTQLYQQKKPIDNPLSVFESSSIRAAASMGLAVSIASTALLPEANAYVPSDYASETVQAVIQDLKEASGKTEETFKVYENIAGIITEGKGVGGQINYKGVQLDRGYVADEDTSIYNPGLSLLTESEKERLVEGVIQARKAGLQTNQWDENNEYAYEFLRQKLDPFHTTELRGFLNIVPFYGAAIYLVVLAVQQFFRDAFQIAYLVGVVAFFGPILGLVLAGP